ncbi:MAG: hypothetical protein NTZ11_14835 [Gammaproteobacteria bacterium]|nr:hypothetical protein [Gammaproteobacteria bacterium]
MSRLRPTLRALALALALALLPFAVPAAPPPALQLIEFRSADCMACDAAADALAADPGWQRALQRVTTITVATDDGGAGRERAARYRVGRLPTWLLINADGEELGRVAGAQTPAVFSDALNGWLRNRSTARSRSARAVEITRDGAAALAETLARYHASTDGDGGFAWWLRLPIAVRGQQSSASPEVLHWRNRIEFLQAAQRGNALQADAGGHKVLEDPRVGCDRGVELARYLDSTRALDPARRRASLAAFRADAEAALAADAFAEPPRCVDTLPLVIATADLLAALDEHAAARKLLAQAIRVSEQQLAADAAGDRRALPKQLAVLRSRLASEPRED